MSTLCNNIFIRLPDYKSLIVEIHIKLANHAVFVLTTRKY